MTSINASSPLPREFNAILQKLEEAGNRFRLAMFIGAVARFAVLVGPVATMALLTAGLLGSYAGAWVVWLLLAAIPTSIAIGYWWFLHDIIWRRPAYGQIARWVEEQAAAQQLPLDNHFINAVLLADELEKLPLPSAGRTDMRSVLIPQVLKEISTAVEADDLSAVAPWPQQRKTCLRAGVIVLACVLVGLFFHHQMGYGLAVLSAPGRFVPTRGIAQILAVQPGNETILAGEPVDFMVRINTPGHQLVATNLYLHFQSGAHQKAAMIPFGRHYSSFRFHLASVAENVTYMVSAGGTQSLKYHLTVLPKIALQQYAINITPPPYTHLPPRTIILQGPAFNPAAASVTVPFGSKISLAATLDHTVIGATALVEQTGGKTIPAISSNQKTFAVSWIAEQKVRYHWLLNDARGNALQRFPASAASAPDQLLVRVTADAPPMIHVLVPHKDLFALPGANIPLEAKATADYGLRAMALQIAVNGGSFTTLRQWQIPNAENGRPATLSTVRTILALPSRKYQLGQNVHYRFTATDNRQLTIGQNQYGPQTALGRVYTVKLQSSASSTMGHSRWALLEQRLEKMLAQQQGLIVLGNGIHLLPPLATIHHTAAQVAAGQRHLWQFMNSTYKQFPFIHSMAAIQQALDVIAHGDATVAVARADDLGLVSEADAVPLEFTKLHTHQLNVLNALKALLAMAGANAGNIDSVVSHQGTNFPDMGREQWRQLALALKKMEKQQRGVMNTSMKLAEKPINQFDAKDKNELLKAQAIEDKWSKFLNQKLVNISNLTEQDQANASLKDDLAQMNVDMAMAKGALAAKAMKIVVPLEQEGLEDAKKINSNIEKWLLQKPDTYKWEMEEPVTQNDVPAPPLPSQLSDMIGKLLQHEEDLTSDMESLGSKWNDSINKGNGWGAIDGPISDMSAQGVTGNTMPKNDEIQGRSGSGREGRASGEMVGATASNKGGRRTPTRLTGDQFSSGQIKDSSKQPPGGATGGGKSSGYGGEGLEGPAPQGMRKDIKRMAGIQAQLLNQADRLRIQLRAAGFNNFKLIESAVLMQDAQKAMNAYQYHTALLYQKLANQSLNTAKVINQAESRLTLDNTTVGHKTLRKVSDSMLGSMPKGYADPVKAYFEKLSQNSGQ
ncbi:MAG: hypothetical protein ACP5I8_07745 [Phycisphaerae bacterium]